MADYISREAALSALFYAKGRTPEDDIKAIPAADVVPFEDYKHLLKVARAMHTWIFLNTCDEQKAYDECHLTDEDNDLLGYGGQFILAEGGGDDGV